MRKACPHSCRCFLDQGDQTCPSVLQVMNAADGVRLSQPLA